MLQHLYHAPRVLKALLTASTFIAGLVIGGEAVALPSCPTVSYRYATPSAGGLIDPGRPTVRFEFTRSIVDYSVLGGTVPAISTSIPRNPFTNPFGKLVWKTYPATVRLYDDYGMSTPVHVTVSGSTVSVTPMADLAPNRKYRFMIHGGSSPILAHHPDSVSAQFCSQPKIAHDIVAEYNTRPTATGGCLTGPTQVTTTRYGLIPGCRYNLSYESEATGNEEEPYIDVYWGWGHVKPTLRIYSPVGSVESRGTKIEVRNLAWNGSSWVAQSAVATATGWRATDQGIPEGAEIARYSNAFMAGNNHILTFVSVVTGPLYGSYDRTISGGLTGKLIVSPAP